MQRYRYISMGLNFCTFEKSEFRKVTPLESFIGNRMTALYLSSNSRVLVGTPFLRNIDP